MPQWTASPHSGFALLLMLIVLMGLGGMAGGRLLSDKVESVNQAKFDHDRKVLQQAREALLSYAVDYARDNKFQNIGRLPCPDRSGGIPGEGNEDGSCGVKHVNTVGYFPWKTLGVKYLIDGSSECLWYVVSGGYKNNPKADMLNEDTLGQLKVQDETGRLFHDVDDLPIALIIAPGSILLGQARTTAHASMNFCKGSYDELDYVESGVGFDYTTDHVLTEDEIWTYVFGSQLENEALNDKIVWITKDEYWDAVYKQRDLDFEVPPLGGAVIEQLTQTLAQCLLNFLEDSNNDRNWLPWPAPVDLNDYRDDAEYIDPLAAPASFMGRLPLDLTNSIAAEHISFPSIISFDSILSDDCLDPADADPDIVDMARLLKNWKDHFFYVVSSDFAINGSNLDRFSRCNPGDCVEVETIGGVSVPEKIAAIVFYASSISGMQSRLTSPDERLDISNYLDTNPVGPNQSNAHDYPNDVGYAGDDNVYYSDLGDLLYCIKFTGSVTPSIFVEKCI
ncbi:MAG: hypothetical protein ACI845_002025 [Gammaproteobacteria bacterium]|jgi:hypothetical protein